MRAKGSFLLINVIGGVAVLASYVWGWQTYPELHGPLWGGVPESWRGAYSINMLFAAAGYLASFWYLLRHVDPEARVGRWGFGFVNTAFAVILFFSLAWMPTSMIILDHRAVAWPPLIFAILAATAVGTAAVGIWLWRLPGRGVVAWLARIGWCFFGLQTILLDGIIWSVMFELPA